MTTPTPDQIAHWPAPNYVDPQTRVNLLLGIEAPVTILTIIFVVARFYSRTYLRHVLGWDDWVMALAAVFAVTITLCHCMSTQYATGYHMWDIKPSWIAPSGKLTYVTLVLFAPTASLAKISICMTYLRVFPSQSDRRFAWFGIFFSIIFCVSVTAINIFQCWPIDSYWDPFDHYPQKCVDRKALTLATQAVNSVSDLLIFLWPARTLYGVRLPKQQRLGLIFVFSIGVIVCVAGVFRLWYLTVYFKSYDLFYKGAIVFILAGLETNLAIICGSLPGCKPLLARFCPHYFGSHSTSSDYSKVDQSRYILPGARMSIRLSRGEPAHLPPASRLRELNRSVTEIRPKSIGGSIMSRTVSVESVPVKLDTQFQPEYNVVLSPLQEVYSPTVSERFTMHDQRSPTFSQRMSLEPVVHTQELRLSAGSVGSERAIYTPVVQSPTVSERMAARGATSWYSPELDNEPEEQRKTP